MSINTLSINFWNVELLFYWQHCMNRYSKRPNGVIIADFSISALFIWFYWWACKRSIFENSVFLKSLGPRLLIFGIRYLSSFISWLRCLKSPHTSHFTGVDFGTRYTGEDQGDFDRLITPACKSAVNSCFATSKFSSGCCRTLTYIQSAISSVSALCYFRARHLRLLRTWSGKFWKFLEWGHHPREVWQYLWKCYGPGVWTAWARNLNANYRFAETFNVFSIRCW